MRSSSIRFIRTGKTLLPALLLACSLLGCKDAPPKSSVTSVGRAVATLHKADRKGNCEGIRLPELFDPQAWWDSLPASNREHPFAGWIVSQPTSPGCAGVRIDSYRAVTTFNLAPVAHLKGLVRKAELVVATRTLPAAANSVLQADPRDSLPGERLSCTDELGGAGILYRFRLSDTVPPTQGTGSFSMLGAAPFPAGRDTVYAFPLRIVAGPLAGAHDSTIVARTGTGGSNFTTDVTGMVNAALNGNIPSLSWMITSNHEGPLLGGLRTSGTFDCRTAYDMDLRITHY